MNAPDHITPFDRALLRTRRARIAPNFKEADCLFQEIYTRLSERLDDMARDFETALVLGARGNTAPLPGVKNLTTADLSPAFQPNIVCDEDMLPQKAWTLFSAPWPCTW